MCRRGFRFVILVLLAQVPANAPAQDDVSWTDKFTNRDMKGYQVEGEVLWNKRAGSGIALKPKAMIARATAMGFLAEVRMDVVLPTGLSPKRGLYLSLHEGASRNETTVLLGIEKGEPVLVSLEYPAKPFPLKKAADDNDGAGPWVVRMRLRYGVVQAKAWNKEMPEPGEWQVVRYTGDSGWEPRIVCVYAGEFGGALERLQVQGDRPATTLFLKPAIEPRAEEITEHTKQVLSLRLKGEYRKAIPLARRLLQATAEVYGPDHAVTASCHNTLGALLFDDGQYQAALEEFETGLRLRRKTLPAEHPHIADSLDATAAALAALGRLDDARTRYSEALAFRRRVLGEDHPATAIGWNNLGSALSLRADHDKALDCFKRSLAIRKAILGEHHPDTAKALNNVGYQLFVMGEYTEARPFLDAALKTYQDIVGPDHPDTGMAENNLGFLLKAMGRFTEAMQHFDRALAIYTRAGGPKHPLRATVLNNEALVYADQGDFATARVLLEEVVAIREATVGRKHADTALPLSSLAMVLWSTGDIFDAIKDFREALEIQQATLPPDHPAIAQTLHSLAGILVAADEKASALIFLEGALAIKRRKLGDRHPETLLTINSLALLCQEIGQSDRALRLLTTALNDCEAKAGADSSLTLLVRHNLGSLLYDLQRYDDAANHLRVALAGFRKTVGPQHPDTARTLNALALAVAAQGNLHEALGLAAESSAAYAAVARRLLAGTAEAQHRLLLEQWRPEFQVFLSLADAAPDKVGDRGTDLLTAVMDWKATSGRALLDRLEAISVSANPAAAAKYEELSVYRRQLVQEVMRGPGSDPIEKYNARLLSLQEKVDARERELGQQIQGYAALAETRRASVADVVAKLPARGALIEFIRYVRIGIPNRTAGKPPEKPAPPPEHYAAVVLFRKPGTAEPVVRLVPLGEAGPIEQAIAAWQSDVSRPRINAERDAELRRLVWDPLLAVLPSDTQRLFIAPDGQLALVPFEAIRLADQRYVIEQYAVSYVSTGRDLLPRPSPGGTAGPPVVLADPDFNLAGPPGAAPADPRSPSGLPPGRSLALSFVPRKESRLSGFAVEADAVEKLLRERLPETTTRVFRDTQATEENARVVARPRLLYVITHGEFLRDLRAVSNPLGTGNAARDEPPRQGETAPLSLGAFGEDPRLRSYLALAGVNHWQERAASGLSDGLLTALEVQSMDLWGTDLVVTAACQTGVGEMRIGEGVLGLRRAFQQAGARTVIATLWPVPDTETARLVPRFLALWLAGTPKAAALRQAQLEMIAQLRKSSLPSQRGAPPLFWAGFVCHGLPE